MGCHGIMRSLAGQQKISVKHLACSSGGKGSKSSDTSSSCSRRNYLILIFRNAMLTRRMAELNHLHIQQAEKQHWHACSAPSTLTALSTLITLRTGTNLRTKGCEDNVPQYFANLSSALDLFTVMLSGKEMLYAAPSLKVKYSPLRSVPTSGNLPKQQ